MNSVFSEQILADKLSKLNSTQQCIETLSHWCIFHRSKADVVVATWKEQFHKTQMAQKIPLLYLANDILQNSKRKGNEFVTEFWKVLPLALKDVYNNGDDQGKKVVSRLVEIWEERRVFGSKPQKLMDVILGDGPPPTLELNRKRSRAVKIVRRDARSIRTKLSIGGPAEKIVSAFHLVLNDHATEEKERNRCKSAVNRVRKLDDDVEIACTEAKNPKRATLAQELEEEENTLKECIDNLKSVEANRVALVSTLRVALQEQESDLENIRTQLQVAQAQAEEVNSMRKRLTDENYVGPPPGMGNSKKTAADIAAEVADKLAASSSSQLIMSSVLSSFAAEEAKKAALANTTVSKPEQTTSVSDPNGHITVMQSPAPAPALPHQYQSVLINQPTLHSGSSTTQNQYQVLPNTTSQQYAQTPIGVAGYGYGNLPPGPPPPPHVMGPMMPMAQGQLQMNQTQIIPMAPQSASLTRQQQQQSMMLMQQPPIGPNFRPLQPPGMGFYTHTHQLQ